MGKAVFKRISREIDKKNPKEKQAGFRSGRGKMKQISIIPVYLFH